MTSTWRVRCYDCAEAVLEVRDMKRQDAAVEFRAAGWHQMLRGWVCPTCSAAEAERKKGGRK